jgi:hypothetical protein
VSTEYVRVQVTATKNGLVYNPTSDTVMFCFTAVGQTPSVVAPASWSAGSIWVPGSWETVGTTYVALGLVGPNVVPPAGTVLSVGTYSIWVSVQDNPELPSRPVGTLQIF